MRIQHNIMAMNAYRNYNTNTSALSKNLEKLSSGYKINRAGDDAAGLAISEKMRAQITGLNAAQKNVKDGISLVKTAEGAMQEIQDMLNRMDYLATQSANGTYDNEVDRANLQKEVDALKSEINRIADSSNFNGIKLLDGKAGINTSAFTKFENVDGVLGHNGSVTIPDASWGAAGTTTGHTETAASTQQNAEAVIDLSGITLTAAATGDTVTADIKLGADTYSISLTGKTSYTKADIAAALKTAIQASANAAKAADGTKDGTAGNNDSVRIGDYVYKMDATDADGLKLTLAGVGQAGGTYKTVSTSPTAATNEFNPTQATEINSALGFTVTMSNVAGATGQSGDAVHLTTKVKQAVAHVDSSLSGIDLKLDSSIVKQGNVLEIDGKKYMFQTEATAPTASNGEEIINVSGGKNDTEKVHMAADLLSQKAKSTGTDGREWKIGSKGTDTIHFEQVKKSDAGKELKDLTDVKNLIKVTGTPTNDKGAGVAITTDPTKVAAGNTLQFGTGDNAVELKIVESGANAANHEINKADITDAAKIQAALGSDYEVTVANGTGDDADKKIITVYSALTTKGNQAAIDATSSPIVSGTGLQLQIGDTSDSYNQLAVKIGDMHTSALGIAKLDISNPEGAAAAAIQTVRDAINNVSSVRGDLGAIQNRLEHTANNLSVMAENIQDAESTIRDTDIAEEMMSYTKNNILIQSAQAMLAQANAVPQGVLQLLG